MDKEIFFNRFRNVLGNVKENYQLDDLHDAFIMWFGEHYLFLDPSDVKERIVKDSAAEGIDAILLDNTNYNLIFVQCRTVDSFSNTNKNYSESDLKSVLEGMRFLIKGNYKGKITPQLENLVDEYHEYDKTGDYQTQLIFITLTQKPVDDKFVANFRQDFPQIQVVFYDFDWFLNYYKNIYLVMRAEPPDRISFKVLSNILVKSAPHKSRIFTCKGEEVAKIYNDHREKIFQQNVRYSLGIRSRSINKQILETAMDNNNAKDFRYFNNGITIVCKEINETSSGKVINLRKAQIINGAQTTYALYEAFQSGTLKDDVEVPIRVIETDSKDFIERVTLYTNSQNAIRLRDLCSNDEIQLRIQKILLDTYKYFFERKRGEFDSLYPTAMSKTQLLGLDYRAKVLSNENAAQSFLALYLNKPAQAKAEKGRIFLKDGAGFYYDIFNPNDAVLAEKMLMSWKLLQFIEERKEAYRKDYRKAEGLFDEQRNAIYKYDFLLHAEYFVLNLFRDFLLNRGLDIDNKRDNVLQVVQEIDMSADAISLDYETIKETLADCVNKKLKTQPGYYHNKFFKNEKSIGLIRTYFKQQHPFVAII